LKIALTDDVVIRNFRLSPAPADMDSPFSRGKTGGRVPGWPTLRVGFLGAAKFGPVSIFIEFSSLEDSSDRRCCHQDFRFVSRPRRHGFPVFTGKDRGRASRLGNDRGRVNRQGCQAESPDSTTQRTIETHLKGGPPRPTRPAIPTWKVGHPGIAIPNGIVSARTDNVQADNRIS